MTPNCHRHAVESERNVSPTLERSSKLSSKGLFSYFLTARHRKQSTKIYNRKSYRTARQTPDSAMRAITKDFWPILRRLAGARKSSSPKSDRKLKDIQMMKKRDVQDCELDTLREKNKISGSGSEYCKESNGDWDTQSKGNGITRNIRKARESPAPKLSFVQRSNFRNRLYYQLNVVKGTKEKPANLNTLKLERLELGSYCPLKRLKGKHYLGFERSKPISMQTRRISEVDFDSRSSKLPNGEISESDNGSDSQDVFTLDIGPIERS